MSSTLRTMARRERVTKGIGMCVRACVRTCTVVKAYVVDESLEGLRSVLSNFVCPVKRRGGEKMNEEGRYSLAAVCLSIFLTI